MCSHALPFLKWVGGKRWLVSRFRHIFPEKYNTYYEPFLGGGAVFFGLQPERAVLSDANEALIACYQAIRDDYAKVWRYLLDYRKNHSDEFYYVARAERARSRFREAARFIYLNRTCFNGIYRENLRGIFNVPRGTKNSVIFPDDNFQKVSDALSGIILLPDDFENTIDRVNEGDFVFVDPPYTVRHNCNGFVKYNQKIFSWQDQVRLKAAISRAAARGAMCLVTNANHQSIRNLYEDMGEMVELQRPSIVAASTSARGHYSELALLIGFGAKFNATCSKVECGSYQRQ